jgi:hypothetical protein
MPFFRRHDLPKVSRPSVAETNTPAVPASHTSTRSPQGADDIATGLPGAGGVSGQPSARTVEQSRALLVPRLLHNAAARDIRVAAERLQDEANDVLLGAPGQPGNSRRTIYLDRWRAATLGGLTGPWDGRLR